jgi:transposase
MAEGQSVREVARTFGVHAATIYRLPQPSRSSTDAVAQREGG